MGQEALSLTPSTAESAKADALADGVNPVVDTQGALLVVFDGGCPVCRREIAHYQRLQPVLPLHFMEVSSPRLPAQAPPVALLLARLHARLPNGLWLSGAEAFVAMWACLPGWRWLARAMRVPGATPALELIYRLFLRVRPLWRPAAAACPIES